MPEGLPQSLTDLHIHVGGAVAPHIMYALAHQRGFKLPVADYWGFLELITSTPEKVKSLEDYIKIMHQWTERIQSSPAAIERSVYEILGKEYRGSCVELMELRFNPMKRNEGGVRDLDHIITAALIGLDRAKLEYGVQAGLIFCLAREFPFEQNKIIVEKAIRYKARGVIGIDLAGTEEKKIELEVKHLKEYSDLFKRARDSGLGVTVHTGETKATGSKGVLAVLKHLKPHRIGHGIQAAQSEEAMAALREHGVVLELCPTSNLHTRAVSGIDELRTIIRTFIDHKVKLTINTDGPYLLQTDIRREFELLLSHNILNSTEAAQCVENARKASFLRP